MLPVEDPSRGTFRAWNAAQTPVLPISRVLAGAVAGALQKRQLSARASSASLRPLNNLLMPAVAVELAPGSKGLPELSSANYQQQAAAAIAEAVASMRDRLGAQP
jgi:N-acetylmuramoyl-L-alanine amidase